jgi:cysteine desulfurase/selenocysteine lyase
MPTKSFNYVDKNVRYFDSACQSLRPEIVISSEIEYYTRFNACAGRGNHIWGQKVDEKVNLTRKKLLDYVGKSDESYCVVFGLNATTLINLVLTNLNYQYYNSFITTHKEHNSIWLPVISHAKRYKKDVLVLDRDASNNIVLDPISKYHDAFAAFALNSNVDGQGINNLNKFVNTLKNNNATVLIDACQSLAHTPFNLADVDFDVLVGSGHKMYAPSLGFMIIKRSLIRSLDQITVGGGTIEKLENNNYTLINHEDELHGRLELGLQDYAAINALGTAIDWLKSWDVEAEYPEMQRAGSLLDEFQFRYLNLGSRKRVLSYLNSLADYLFLHLKKLESERKIILLNKQPSTVVSFIPRNRTSYELSNILSKNGVYLRSGYLCCHHYIEDQLKMPAVTRVSFGLQNTVEDISFLIHSLNDLL